VVELRRWAGLDSGRRSRSEDDPPPGAPEPGAPVEEDSCPQPPVEAEDRPQERPLGKVECGDEPTGSSSGAAPRLKVVWHKDDVVGLQHESGSRPSPHHLINIYPNPFSLFALPPDDVHPLRLTSGSPPPE